MSLSAAFRTQAEVCTQMGSPFMGQLLSILAEDFPADTKLSRKVDSFEGDIGPAGHSLPLRIAAGLHALVLKRGAPALAALYPPQEYDEAALRDALLTAITAHGAFLSDWIDSPPQTNELRRSAALIAGARVALQHFNLPIWLSELGASGGLNMMWDEYALDIKGARFGPSLPALILSPEWSGPLPPKPMPHIAARAGVDLTPLDLARADHMLRLTAYLWPDQPDRLRMTRAAASIIKAPIAQGDAIDWLARRLPMTPQGHLHLIQHSITWQYLSPAAQARGTALIEAAGTRATRTRPLAWLSMETDHGLGEGAAITLRLWPGDLRLNLGRADFHGRWIKWQYPT